MDVLDPKIVFMNAFKGALGGAIAGGRRSIDGETLRGVAQGAAMGAVGGVVAGQITEHDLAPLAAGAVTGYVGSRGPRGPSRPQLHLRLDNGLAAGNEKMATELPLPLHPDRDTRAVLAVLAAMRGHRRHEPRPAGEKHALSAGVVEAAAAKRGVSPRFLQALAKRRTGSNKGQALTSWIGSGSSANKYLTSWMANKPHVKHAAGSKMKGFTHGVIEEAPAALGAVLGAGIDKAHGGSGVRGAALGYGVGAAADMAGHALWHKGKQMLANRAMAGKWAPAGRKLLKAAVAGPQNNADPVAVEAARAAVKATPLGERVLADSDGKNEPPLVAMLALRRLLRSGKPGA